MHFGNGRYCWLSTIWLPSRNHHLGSGSDFVTSDAKRPIIAQNDCTVISVHMLMLLCIYKWLKKKNKHLT